MIEIIEVIKDIIQKGGKTSLINSYQLDSGIYIKVDDKPLTYEDLFHVNDNIDKGSVIDRYNWFVQRSFFEGILNSDTNKTISLSGDMVKKIHSVTPYALFFKYENIDLVINSEIIRVYLEEVNNLNGGIIDIPVMSKVFLDRVIELKKILEENEVKMNSKDRILFFTDNSPEAYEESYLQYIKNKGFNKSFKIIDIDGEHYGVPSLGITLDAKKPILTSSDNRDVPYRLSASDCLILHYVSKLKRNISDIMENCSGEKYDIDINISDINRMYKVKSVERSKEFHKFSIVSKNTSLSIDSIKTRQEVLELIENSLTSWTITPAITWYMVTSSELQDYIKNNLNKIDNQYILQQILSDRDCFKYYFNGNEDIDISVSLERIIKAVYEYKCNEKNPGNKTNQDEGTDLPFALFTYRLDMILSIMDYISGKEKYKNMAITLDILMAKFIKDKENGKVSIDNDAEFYFLSGQLIRFLASLSEKKNKKADLMGNFMLRNKDKVKDHIIDMYELYSHKIPLFSESYVNMVYQQVMAYSIGEKEVKNKDNWYYYQAGLSGKNIIFYKEQIEAIKTQEEEELLEELEKRK